MYTEEDLERAKAYLRSRIENEVSMSKDVDKLLDEYAEYIIDVILSEGVDGFGGVMADIDLLVDDLIAQILADCRLLSVDDHTDMRDEILAYIERRIGDNTLEERVSNRVRTFAHEVMAVGVAGLLFGMGRGMIIDSVRTNKNAPWDNPILRNARDKAMLGDAAFIGGVSALNISLDYFEEPHYGRGVPISSDRAITDICVFAISEAWGYYDYITNRDTSTGYYVLRGSGFPCEECDSHVGYHPISDEEDLPMFHNHCRCYTVWARVEG